MKLQLPIILSVFLAITACGETDKTTTPEVEQKTQEVTQPKAEQAQEKDQPKSEQAQENSQPKSEQSQEKEQPKAEQSQENKQNNAQNAEEEKAESPTKVAEADIDHPGYELHLDNCERCHSPDFYKPTDRVAKYSDISRMVKACDNQLGTMLFDEDMDNITNFLNDTYYKYPVK